MQIAQERRALLFGQQQTDVAADQRLRLQSEQMRGGRVGILDSALDIDLLDVIAADLDQGTKALLALTQRLLGLSTPLDHGACGLGDGLEFAESQSLRGDIGIGVDRLLQIIDTGLGVETRLECDPARLPGGDERNDDEQPADDGQFEPETFADLLVHGLDPGFDVVDEDARADIPAPFLDRFDIAQFGGRALIGKLGHDVVDETAARTRLFDERLHDLLAVDVGLLQDVPATGGSGE